MFVKLMIKVSKIGSRENRRSKNSVGDINK